MARFGERELPKRQSQVHDAHSQVLGERVGQKLPLHRRQLEQHYFRVGRFDRLVHQADLSREQI